jgi:hypothetical protein
MVPQDGHVPKFFDARTVIVVVFASWIALSITKRQHKPARRTGRGTDEVRALVLEMGLQCLEEASRASRHDDHVI